MQKLSLEITNPTGLHTRPGTGFVRLAKTFESDIRIAKGDKIANAKSLVKLLRIGISQGDVVEITTEGRDEQQALLALGEYAKNLQE